MAVISAPIDTLQGFEVPFESVKKDHTEAGDRRFSLFIVFFEWSSHVCGNSQAILNEFIIKASKEIHSSYRISWV